MAPKDDEEVEIADDRLFWVEQRVANCLRRVATAPFC